MFSNWKSSGSGKLLIRKMFYLKKEGRKEIYRDFRGKSAGKKLVVICGTGKISGFCRGRATAKVAPRTEPPGFGERSDPLPIGDSQSAWLCPDWVVASKRRRAYMNLIARKCANPRNFLNNESRVRAPDILNPPGINLHTWHRWGKVLFPGISSPWRHAV